MSALTGLGVVKLETMFGDTLGSEHRLSLDPPWSICASYESGESVDRVELTLLFGEERVGNIHRVTTPAALSKLPGIIATLRALVGSDAIRCPKCKLRWVSTKVPSRPGQAWSPFLSCNGMRVSRSRKNRHVACDGTSKALQPVVIYSLEPS